MKDYIFLYKYPKTFFKIYCVLVRIDSNPTSPTQCQLCALALC